MSEDYKVDPRKIHIDQRKKDTRRDAWNRDYLTASEWAEIEEACKIEPKRDYTFWLFAIFFIFILVLMSGCTTIEVGSHVVKTTYNNCIEYDQFLENWQCYWNDGND